MLLFGKQYTKRAIRPLPRKAVLFIMLSNIRLTRKADAHIGLFQHYRFPCGSVADVGLAIPRFQQEVKIRDITQILFNNDFIT